LFVVIYGRRGTASVRCVAEERREERECTNQQPLDFVLGYLQLHLERVVLHGEGGELTFPLHLVLLVVELLSLQERAQLPKVPCRLLDLVLSHGNLLGEHGFGAHLLRHWTHRQMVNELMEKILGEWWPYI
jgi:hypothetical protein